MIFVVLGTQKFQCNRLLKIVDELVGNGTIEEPYKFEDTNQLIGSYVKLDNNIWRIYQVNDTEIRLIFEGIYSF